MIKNKGVGFDDQKPTPLPIGGKYIIELIGLHYFNGILTRSALARVTGINERLLGHYATGHRNPRPAQRQKIIDGIHKIGAEFNAVV